MPSEELLLVESLCHFSKNHVMGKKTIAELKLTEIFLKIKYSWIGVSYFTTADDPWGKFI